MSNTPARLLRLLSMLQTPREWLGCEFTVHEPVELIDHLLALAGRITRAVQK